MSAELEYPSHLHGDIPLIRLDEGVEPANFQAFEVSNTQYRPIGSHALKPRVSPEVMAVAREMITGQFQSGQGLEKNGQGIKDPIQVATQLGKAGLGYSGGFKRRNPYKKVPPQLTTILMPKFNIFGPKDPVKKIPAHISSLLMPKIGGPVEKEVENGDVLISTKEQKARNEQFLQEIQQQFEKQFHLSHVQGGEEEKGDNDVNQATNQEIIPFIDWTRVDIPKEWNNLEDEQISAIIEDITHQNVASILVAGDGVTTDNWTVEPQIVHKG